MSQLLSERLEGDGKRFRPARMEAHAAEVHSRTCPAMLEPCSASNNDEQSRSPISLRLGRSQSQLSVWSRDARQPPTARQRDLQPLLSRPPQ